MKVGNTGLSLGFYAAFAFILALIGQMTLATLLLAFVIIAEKDEWLTLQVLQALILIVCSNVLSSVMRIFRVFTMVPVVGRLLSVVLDRSNELVSVILIIFAVMGIVKVIKGKDADIPGVATLAKWLLGKKQGE
jgi:hypothetical protein